MPEPFPHKQFGYWFLVVVGFAAGFAIATVVFESFVVNLDLAAVVGFVIWRVSQIRR
jgi:hypothetical protein